MWRSHLRDAPTVRAKRARGRRRARETAVRLYLNWQVVTVLLGMLTLVAGVGILAEPAEGEAGNPLADPPLLLVARNLPLAALRLAVQASSAAAGVVRAAARRRRLALSEALRQGWERSRNAAGTFAFSVATAPPLTVLRRVCGTLCVVLVRAGRARRAQARTVPRLTRRCRRRRSTRTHLKQPSCLTQL